MTLQIDSPATEDVGNSNENEPLRRRPNRLRALVEIAGSDRRIGVAVATTSAAVFGLVAGWWTPRGPITIAQALTTMVISLAVGALAGVTMRSRWAMLLSPVVFATVFELTRLDATGPTVDRIHVGSTYGIMALVVGRVFHGVLALWPMALGASIGAASARRVVGQFTRSSRHGAVVALHARRVVSIVSAVALVVLAMLIAQPANTEAIVGADGKPLAGSIAELTRVRAGGHDLAMMIRGNSIDNPVMLFLAGGPGGTELGAVRKHGEALEQDFVVATLDQRGTGKSYDQLEPTSTLTLANAVSDAIEVTNYLRDRFGQDKIYLVGQSWGSILGVLVAQQHPELFHAFVGVGQMVSPPDTDRVFYDDTLAWARRTGDTGLVHDLTTIGPPPYTNVLNYETALSYEHEVYPYDHSINDEGQGGMSENIFVEEYDRMQQVHNLAAMLDVFKIMYPQIQGIDFRVDAAKLDVPVYLVEGAHEAPGRSVPADEWFKMLDAPAKQWILFDTSGHRPLFEQPELFHTVMTETVLAETQPK